MKKTVKQEKKKQGKQEKKNQGKQDFTKLFNVIDEKGESFLPGR